MGKLIALWLEPPGLLISLGLIGLVIGLRYRRALPGIFAAVLTCAWLLCTPAVGALLMEPLEWRRSPQREPLPADLGMRHDAVVVLAGGRLREQTEMGGRDTVSPETLARVRYGARLARATGLPVLVSGGSVERDAVPEAELMQQSLVRDFGVHARWVESLSRDTLENARYSADILLPEGMRRILLVTQAVHMPRSLMSFRAAGFDPTPAATLFRTAPHVQRGQGLEDWMPSLVGLRMSSQAIHEYLGIAWYWWRLN